MTIIVSKRVRLMDGTNLRMHFLLSPRGEMKIRIVVGKGNDAKRYEGNSFHTEGSYIILGTHAAGDPNHLGPSEIHVVERFGPVAVNLKDSGTERPQPSLRMPAPGRPSEYATH